MGIMFMNYSVTFNQVSSDQVTSLNQTPTASGRIMASSPSQQAGGASVYQFIPSVLTGAIVSPLARDPDLTARRLPGSGKGWILGISPDFDEPLP